MIINSSTEPQAAIDGLKSIAATMFAFRIAEQTFLIDLDLKDDFRRAVLPLYRQILEYQATAAKYFGRNTMIRLGRDTLAGTRWKDALTAVQKCETDSKSSTGFLGGLQQQSGLAKLLDILTEQSSQLAKLSIDVSARKDEATQVLQWASHIPYYLDHYDVRTRIAQSREQWIRNDSKYAIWRSAKSGILFLEGTVGKGKTSLVSEVIEDVLEMCDSRVAFFYCSRYNSTRLADTGTTSRDDPVHVIRSVMAQFSLSAGGLTVAGPMKSRYADSLHKVPGGCTMQLQECLDLVRETFRDQPQTSWTIIIDALDECKAPRELLDSLKFLNDSTSRLRFLVSSREGNLEYIKNNCFPLLTLLNIEQKNSDDIRKYIQKEVQMRRQGVSMSDAQAHKLETILLRRAQGM